MNRKRSLLIFNRILLESIQSSGKRKTQEPFLYKSWHKLWHTFYETLCQKVQNFTIKQEKTAQNRRFLPMAERKGSCNSEAGEFTRKSGASALRRKGSRRRRHDATQRAESLLLSTEKQNGQAFLLVRFVGGEKGIRTLAPVS